MNAHVFVDETKERGLLIAAAVVLPADLAAARRTIRDLILPGQRRIHFHKERDDRRRQIIAALGTLSAHAVILDARGHRDARVAREACLVALVEHAAKINAARLVLERDDSTFQADRRLLFEQVRKSGMSSNLRYDQLRAHEECLLAIPDALAWCWAKGGRWKTSVQRVIRESRQV
ncbi:hypothetical protein JNW91_10965 [Micromonospora sp. STR1_7]|uniref:DUF3800 domain-containing protein n=1 Tax=Micromonospora parastrephiae TaxID=2806101 RepID=A0ABS1XSU7_9ACTN|nr:hypothetical protein [Micromonospora parastrephiae]MBM0232337.1 hypothetical protein [Micromonospora parastrephiae]